MLRLVVIGSLAAIVGTLAGCTAFGGPVAGFGGRASDRVAAPFRDCPDCPGMVVVPSGTFLIGSPPDEPGRSRPRAIDEGPQRRIAIRAFAIGRTPVTRGEWAAFVADIGRPVAGGCSWSALPGVSRDGTHPDASWQNLGFAQTDDHPAVCIGWADAHDYAQWLGQRTGRPYRLPSEAEWEYAARGGTTTPFPWGSEARRDRANYGTERCCSGEAEGADRWVQTSPVASFPANAFGLYDMHGNAMQWVEDCLSPTYADLPEDGSPYRRDDVLQLTGDFARLSGRRSCEFRILRGGNWGDPPAPIRSAARNFGPPPNATLAGYRSAGGGFRVVRALDR